MSSTNQNKPQEIFEKIIDKNSNDEFTTKLLKEMYIIKK